MKFPWPDIREFINVSVALALTKQNYTVGSQMLDKAPDEESKAQIAKQLGEVHLSLSALEARARSVDATIVAKLLQAEQDAPRLILPS